MESAAWIATTQMPLVFAHEGGWDEALLVLGPLALIGGVLHMANRRLKSRIAELEETDDTSVEGA